MVKTKALLLIVSVNVSLTLLWYCYSLEREFRNFAESDYNKLMNIRFDFKHLPTVYNNSSSKFFLAIHTAPSHFDRRKYIRNTWGRRGNIAVIFFVGLSKGEETQTRLQREITEHGDFVQGSFLDTMHNITYKHLMIFKFFIYYRPDIEYVVKVNDYAFVNMPNLIDFMEQYSAKHNESNSILCRTRYDVEVARSGKYALTYDEYPSEVFPTQCFGYFVIYPRRTTIMLYIAAQNLEYFRMDDVLMTGILPKRLLIDHTNIDRLILDQDTKKRIVTDNKLKEEIRPFLFVAKNINANDTNALWKYVLRVTPKTKILQYLQLRCAK